MASIYSTRFIGQTVVAGTPAIYTVASGYTAVVRHITLVAVASGVTGISVSLPGDCFVYHATSLATAPSIDWVGRQVFNGGDQLEVSCTGANVYAMVSGYLLSS